MISAILLAAALCTGVESATLTRLEDVQAACSAGTATNAAFDVSGTLLSYFRRTVTREWIVGVSDGTNTVTFYELNTGGVAAESLDAPRLGDRVRLKGVLYDYHGALYPGYRNIELVAHRPPDADADITPADMFADEMPQRIVRMTGVVRDAFRDESDPNFIAMTLVCGGSSALVLAIDPWREIAEPSDYIGKKVAAEGIVANPKTGARRYAGRMLSVSGKDNIHVLSGEAPLDETLPDISGIRPMPPSELALLGRHKTVGTVRAAWHGNRAFVETDAGEIVGVRFAKADLPGVGSRIRVSGFPETDIYSLSLVNATWTVADGVALPQQQPKDVSPSQLLDDKFGNPQINIRTNGRAFRIRGCVRYLPPPGVREKWLGVESDGRLVSVDAEWLAEALDELEIGCEVAVSGVCVVDTEGVSSGIPLPRAKGVFIVPGGAEDMEVLARPPWWTPGRLVAVIGMLAAALAAILLWNVALSRRAERRGRELADERLGRVTSELKVEERTRLAVDLHDAMSQTLAGISMEVGAAREQAQGGDSRLLKRLDFVVNAINACRNELKNCIWDLRSEALEEAQMDDAIRKSLVKDVRDEELTVRFNVPREMFSDNTAHSIVRTIRELAVNAMRHGKAKHIAIAGSIDGDTLRFSVKDDGCGFDPASAPGVAEGHFGIQGIRERIAPFGGTLEIDSLPGKGTKAKITIKLVANR